MQTPARSNIEENDTRQHAAADYVLLNSVITSFNATAHELEQSYRLLHNQVHKLNSEVERKNNELERNLQEKERVKNFLSSILESLPTGVLVSDRTGNLLMCNSSFESITGLYMDESSAAALQQWLAERAITPATERCLERIKSMEFEHERAPDDVRYLKITRSPVIDGREESIGLLYVVQDQTRLKKLEAQSERDKRLKAMGEMAIRIAHEVRNPLGCIELLASIMRAELDEQQDLKKMAERITTEVKSLDNAISNLLLFTRPQKPVLHEADLYELLREFIDFIEPVLAKNNVTLCCHETGRYKIAADRDLIKQVFLNLTLNAMQAMPDGGSVEIDATLHMDGYENQKCHWVEILFRDTGHGVEREALNKIFNPFFTTKEKGTGLGLAIVHNIIESHNGTIDVRSTPGTGTSFLISLPVLSVANE